MPIFSSYTTTFDECEMFVVEAALRHFELAQDPQASWGIDEDIGRIRTKLYRGMSGISLPAPDAESQTSALPRFTFTAMFFVTECFILRDALTEYGEHCRKGLAQDTDANGTDATFSTQDECIESARRKIPRFVTSEVPNGYGEVTCFIVAVLDDPRPR